MRWQEPFGPGRPGRSSVTLTHAQLGRIEDAIRKSERARIVAWLRTSAPNAEDNDIGTLADAIERGSTGGSRETV